MSWDSKDICKGVLHGVFSCGLAIQRHVVVSYHIIYIHMDMDYYATYDVSIAILDKRSFYHKYYICIKV
jgi:hypothetical protein